MKLIIAGSRTLKVDSDFIFKAIELFEIYPTAIISGGANGIDKCGEDYAASRVNVELIQFLPQYDKYPGRIAPLKRNEAMAQNADCLLLIWDGNSRGSANMRKQMLALDKPVYEIIIKETVI